MKQLVELTGKNILITGAGQGIGQATAELCLELGAKLTLLDLNKDKLEAFAKKIGDTNVLAVTGSVADRAVIDDLIKRATDKFGAIDGLVNNAGITRTAMIDKMTDTQWQDVIDIHLTGSFICLQTVGKHMISRAKPENPMTGAIVNVSSDAGRRGTIGQINYGTAKAGVFGMTMSAALEWARYGIRVNTVAFGVVETEMTEVIRSEKFRDRSLARIPIGRFASPAEVVKPICFLLSDAASYITGQHLSINGGGFMSA